MACIIDSGYALGCASIGGIKNVWMGTYDSSMEYTLDTSTDEITAVTNGADVYQFEQDVAFAGLEQTGNFSRENGTVYYDSVLSLKFLELDATLRKTILALGRAPVFAIVESNAGLFYLLGLESAGRATEGVASLGTEMGDLNGATLSFTFSSKAGAYLIDGDLIGTDIPLGT